EARQQLDDSSFARSVASDQRNGLPRVERETHVFERGLRLGVFAGIGKTDIAKLYVQSPGLWRGRHGPWLLGRGNLRLVFEKLKKRADKEVIFIGAGDTIEHALEIRSHLHRCLCIERESSQGDT